MGNSSRRGRAVAAALLVRSSGVWWVLGSGVWSTGWWSTEAKVGGGEVVLDVKEKEAVGLGFPSVFFFFKNEEEDEQAKITCLHPSTSESRQRPLSPVAPAEPTSIPKDTPPGPSTSTATPTGPSASAGRKIPSSRAHPITAHRLSLALLSINIWMHTALSKLSTLTTVVEAQSAPPPAQDPALAVHLEPEQPQRPPKRNRMIPRADDAVIQLADPQETSSSQPQGALPIEPVQVQAQVPVAEHTKEKTSSRQIPKSLTKLEHLIYLNVSFNELAGEIPDEGPFGNFTAASFIGNTELCGSSRFHVKACKNQSNMGRNRKKTVLKFVLGPVIVGTIVMGIFFIWLLKYRKRNDQVIPLTALYGQSHKRFSYYEIVRGTNNFEESNLIGKGSLGMVYKGTFANGVVVAVKALVLEYMPNGDLDYWLYSHNNFLDLVQRMKIMVDVASALEYLHQGHSLVVVHCDLKPSNILLDEKMVARVGDFGISKLLTVNDPVALTKTLGTIGYMAPEYGSEGIVSTMGDVYSYGILLMETFTRKKPVDDQFVGELNLKRWIAESYPHRVMGIVDANLFSRDDQHLIAIETCMRSVLELALECSSLLRLSITHGSVSCVHVFRILGYSTSDE
uniref:non-specific serine/threonine protein kinase n=1 Tax=Nicotiana tabacum TaxID=4097 RepID=A0A1S3YZA3_TOBAC|nr:PREDICTED: probable LRR receptor-like serine/threonine-protein kinase At3g47570 [Nicotiana tabacum]